MNVRARNPEQTRLELLTSAYAEMLQYGFQAASLERILTKTNVSKGALYHHFATKQELGLAVVKEVIAADLKRRWIDPLISDGVPLATLDRLLMDKIDTANPESIRLGCPLNNLIQEMSPLDETFRATLQGVLDRWTTAIAVAFEQGQREGNVRKDVDPKETAIFLVAAIEGCVGLGKNLQSVEAYRGCLRQLRLVLQGLTP